jgi:hypothetical protein
MLTSTGLKRRVKEEMGKFMSKGPELPAAVAASAALTTNSLLMRVKPGRPRTIACFATMGGGLLAGVLIEESRVAKAACLGLLGGGFWALFSKD